MTDRSARGLFAKIAEVTEGGAQLVGVREPSEVAQMSHAGCEVVNISLRQFEDRWREVPATAQ